MKTLKMLLLMTFVFCMNIVNSFAQIKAEDVTIKVNKATKQMELIKKADGTNLTASFKVVKANIDIFDKGGDYAGTLELKDWAIPLDEFSPDEIVKISSISIAAVDNSQTIELKDIRLEH